MKSIEVLLLSQKDIMALSLATVDVLSALEQALYAHAQGAYEMQPKLGVHPTRTGPANFIHAMPAYLPQQDACGLKWVGGFMRNRSLDLPTISGLQVLNDSATGLPLAVMDCSYLTALRTSAISLLFVRACARKPVQSLAVVGCGFEGTMHIQFFVEQLPHMEEIRLHSKRPAAMREIKALMRDTFFGEVRLCDDYATCLEGADVMITCTTGEEQFIQPRWFKPGALGIGLEGGCAYTAEALHQADKFMVDDVALAESFDRIGRERLTSEGFPDPEFPGGMPPIHATLAEVMAGKKPGRESDHERIIAVPLGLAICDVAIAQLAYRQALKQNIGQIFRLA